ncbi:MAG: glycosyltransferase family 9 protein [Bacteroidota bacterium]
MTDYRRILLTRLKFIGDVVLTTPIIRSVRNACPSAHLAYLGDREAVSLLENNPCLDEIIPYDFSRPSITEQLRVAATLRRERFDLVIDMFNNPRSALLVFASGASTRVGLDRKGRGRLYTVRVRDDGTPKSPIEFHNQLLRAVGIPPTSSTTEIFLTSEERHDALQFLPEGEAPLVGIHPGATWPAKRWSAERFGALADLLSAEGLRVAIFGAPGDQETIQQVIEATVSVPHVLPVAPLRSLAAMISHCSVFVCNDAGPMHIAAALNIPTVGIFGPGEENIWFPYDRRQGHIALRRDVPCHPCHADFCPRTGDGYMECMELLQVNDVADAVRNIL